MKKKKTTSKFYLYGAIGCIAVIAIVGYLYCFSSFSKSSETKYVYIDAETTSTPYIIRCSLSPRASRCRRSAPSPFILAMPTTSASVDTPSILETEHSRSGVT